MEKSEEDDFICSNLINQLLLLRTLFKVLIMFLITPLILSVIALILIKRQFNNVLFIFPYLFYLIVPILTYYEVIGTLTGFDGRDSDYYIFGLAFYSISLAYQLSKYKNEMHNKPYEFIIGVCNPIYFFTGPIPNKFGFVRKNYSLKRIFKISSIVSGDLGLGLLFATILAPSFATLFYLKDSLNIVDIILFGIFFELFVYFNFAGFSMIAWALMRIAGFKVTRNFRHPFAATSVIEYWQRWHISLSQILKELFFEKIKTKIPLYFAVFIVFFASALWHGVSKNFILWGIFHAFIWCLTHYISKFRKLFFINYFLLFFAIVVGRVIFSEIDYNVLLTKLGVIFNFSKWNSEIAGVYIYSMRDAFNFIIAGVIILFEIISPRYGLIDKDYKYLRGSFMSTLIIFYLSIAFVGFSVEPIYGER
jgi:alginate O-acetyltransferase complex protein AlgI